MRTQNFKMATNNIYKVERVVKKAVVKGKVKYLLIWKGYSSHECSWVDENSLSSDLIRQYNNPPVPLGRLIQNIDVLMCAIGQKLKSKSRLPVVISFQHDCFRRLFNGKGRISRDRKAIMLEKDDFSVCFDYFPKCWNQCLDKNGDGVEIKFPIRVQKRFSWSPKIITCQNGALSELPRMPLEKLAIDFLKQPVSISTESENNL